MMLWKAPEEMALLESASSKAQKRVLGRSPVKGFQGPPEAQPAQSRKKNNHITYLSATVGRVRQSSVLVS